jgi:uncharacterized membrane protein YfcA
MEIQLTSSIFIAVGLACFLTGLSKAGLGGGIGFLMTPMLTLVMPLNKAVGILLPILMLADIFTLAAYWKKWELRRIWILLIGGLAGVTLATFVLVNVSADLLKKGLALLVLLFLIYRMFEKRILASLTYQVRPWHGLLAGSTAGFASTLAHAGGPPITIYLLLQRLEPAVFIATSALFFAVLNWIKVPYYYFARLFDFPLQLRLIWLMPLAPLGVWVGRQIVKRVDNALFERIIIVLLVISVILLIVE